MHGETTVISLSKCKIHYISETMGLYLDGKDENVSERAIIAQTEKIARIVFAMLSKRKIQP